MSPSPGTLPAHRTVPQPEPPQAEHPESPQALALPAVHTEPLQAGTPRAPQAGHPGHPDPPSLCTRSPSSLGTPSAPRPSPPQPGHPQSGSLCSLNPPSLGTPSLLPPSPQQRGSPSSQNRTGSTERRLQSAACSPSSSSQTPFWGGSPFVPPRSLAPCPQSRGCEGTTAPGVRRWARSPGRERRWTPGAVVLPRLLHVKGTALGTLCAPAAPGLRSRRLWGGLSAWCAHGIFSLRLGREREGSAGPGESSGRALTCTAREPAAVCKGSGRPWGTEPAAPTAPRSRSFWGF